MAEDGTRLAAVLSSQGRTATWLAGRIDISIDRMYRLCNGRTEPRGVELLRIAHELGVEPSELVDEPVPATAERGGE